MSTTLSASTDLQYGDQWTGDSAYTTPPDSPIDPESISLNMDILIKLFHNLSNPYLSDVDNKAIDGFLELLHPVVLTDQLLSVKTQWKSKMLDDIYDYKMYKIHNSGWHVAGTALSQWRPILRTINETKYVKPLQDLDYVLVDRLNKIFNDARDEIFEDGMNSVFGGNLKHIIKIYGRVAIHALERTIHADNANVEVVEEALRQIGNMDDITTHDHRLNLLKKELTSPHPRIRYAASIGIEAMDDTRAIESIQNAINNEQHEQLRKNFQNVLMHLQDTQ